MANREGKNHGQKRRQIDLGNKITLDRKEAKRIWKDKKNSNSCLHC